MVWLFRTFRQLPLFARAVDVWTRGDADIRLLQAAAVRLHAEVNSAAAVSPTLDEIAAINSDLTELEVEFSSTLGEAARWVQSVLLLAEGAATAGLLAVAGGLGARRIFQRLNLSEADYRRLVDSAVDAVVGVDADNRIVLFNHAAEQAFGYALDGVLGRSLEDLLSPGDPDLANEAQLFLGRRSDGTVFQAECGISRSTLAGRSGQTYIVRDITERVRSQHVLAESEAHAKTESERLLALHHASTLLAAQTTEPESVLEEVLRSALRLLQGDGASLYQWDAPAGLLRCVRDLNECFVDRPPDVRPRGGTCRPDVQSRRTRHRQRLRGMGARLAVGCG